MAIAPQDTFFSPTPATNIVDIERLIDRKLCDPNNAYMCSGDGVKTPYRYIMAFPGTLTQEQKDKLTRVYTDVGWEVSVKNSEENGELPGLFGIILTQPL